MPIGRRTGGSAVQWLHGVHGPKPGLDIAAADLLEAGVSNHRFEQVDGVGLDRWADDVTPQ
jgi:hypothetical protein